MSMGISLSLGRTYPLSSIIKATAKYAKITVATAFFIMFCRPVLSWLYCDSYGIRIFNVYVKNKIVLKQGVS
jgi:hypothetical protein